MLFTAAVLAGLSTSAPAQVVPATSYDRHFFTEPGAHEAIQAARELSGGRSGIGGWVEYRIGIAAAGWYRLLAHGDPPSGVEFLVNADGNGEVPPERYFYRRSAHGADPSSVGNVWLATGEHRLRLVRHYWTGFPRITAIELRRSVGQLAESVQVFFRSDQRVFRKGECEELVVYGGGGAQGSLEIVDSSADGNRIYNRYVVSIAASDAPVAGTVTLDCSQPGFHRLSYRANGRAVAAETLPPVSFQIIDTSPPAAVALAAGTPALIDIDCAAQAPDYASSGGTQTRSVENLVYRESGDTGWLRYQRMDAAERARQPAPAWFAYALRRIIAQQRYRIEVDYPDDAIRTFAVSWREAAPMGYTVAVAVEAGREYPQSNALRTLAFHVWARASGPRLVLLPAHDGSRAACARIRVYLAGPPASVAGADAPAEPPANRRQFLNWYEEGENFTGLFGTANRDLEEFNLAAERWLQEAAAAGVNTLMPTAVIYNFAMYPSRFNRAFSEPQRDTMRMLLLLAEKYRMRLIPELHPRADELSYPANDRRSHHNLAVSREGRNDFTDATGRRNVPPHFNALDPVNQQWYVGMVRELAQRYRDSPAFQGISLRYMSWANPALNNLTSLDWGYDDDTIARYRTETRSRLPTDRADDAGRFKVRHDWLLAHEKSAWMQWRCAQITLLFTRLRDALRAARPDLRLYVHVFGPAVQAGPDGPVAGRSEFLSLMREAGLDLTALARIDGLVIVNSTFSYGRGEQDGLFFNATRDALLDPAAMGAPPAGPAGQWFVATAQYLEALPEVLPPQKLGLPAPTAPQWMMSAASSPPGRQALERFALLLAGTDALALGDGGNNYTLGSPFVAEFAREFTKLPQVPFEQVPDAVDPVTIRALSSDTAYTFYAVNRESYAVRVRIDLAGMESMDVELQPYELRVFTVAPAARIVAVHTEVPEAERARIAGRIEWTTRLLAGSVGVQPSGGDAKTLADAVAAARSALDRGQLWRAHTVLETSAVLVAFRRVGCFPPDLDLGLRNACTR